jgi:site-specific recombinase XerD
MDFEKQMVLRANRLIRVRNVKCFRSIFWVANSNRGYSAHSMRATFITTALENGASLEDVQRAAGHADPSTTKLYDRRGYNPEKSASFFANY